MADEAPPKKKSKLKWIILIFLLLLVGGGAAGAWFFFLQDKLFPAGGEGVAAAPNVADRVPVDDELRNSPCSLLHALAGRINRIGLFTGSPASFHS